MLTVLIYPWIMKEYLASPIAMNRVMLKGHLIHTPKIIVRYLEKVGGNVAQFWQPY